MLEIREVSRNFSGFKALDRVSLQIETGEFFTLLGPSGCGKTTLLRLIAGFDQPDGGDILLDGKSIIATPPERRPLHTIFQNYALFPHMSVAENIAFPLRMVGCSETEIKQRVAEALQDVSLPDKGQHYPEALSGGQKQRIAIARALVNRPRLLLLDEPLSALDAQLREQMQLELIRLQKEIGITFIYVTHDQGEALALSQRIAVMNNGSVAQVDQPSRLYEHPNSRFVADFIGQCNLLAGEVVQLQGDQLLINLQGLGPVQTITPANTSAEVGSLCTLTLRPEKIRISSKLEQGKNEVHFKGVVHDMLYLGDVTVYKVELANGMLLEALLANSSAGRARLFEVGDPVEVAWGYDAGHLVMD